MTRLANIDERSIVTDWIYEQFPETSEDCVKCRYEGIFANATERIAFFRYGHLWEAWWIYNRNVICIRTRDEDATEKDYNRFMEYLRDDLQISDALKTDISCDDIKGETIIRMYLFWA